MNSIEPIYKLTTVNSNIDNYNNSIFCHMPIEIINNVCEYLDLTSILNTIKSCKLLRDYIIENTKLKKLKIRYNLIYSDREIFFMKQNTSFMKNINILFHQRIY